MSLAEADPVSRRARPQARLHGGVPLALHRPDLDGIVRRVFGFDATEAAAAQDRTAPDLNIAVEALRRGAASLGDLQQRCDRLQSELAETAARHRSELEEARQHLARWHTIATELGAKLQQSQDQLTEAERQGRLQADLAAAWSRRADAAEGRAQSLERITLAFRDSLLDVVQGGAAAQSSFTLLGHPLTIAN